MALFHKLNQSQYCVSLSDNINQITNNIQLYAREHSENVNMTKLWSDDETFSHYFYDLCGKPSDKKDSIRFVERTLYEKDYNGPDKDELDVMPSKFGN